MTALAESVPEVIATHESLFRASLRRFLRHRLAIVGAALILAIAGIAILLPFVVHLDPITPSIGTLRLPPGPRFPLGTDLSGRDVWARVVFGARISLLVGFGAVALYVTLGT